MSWEIKTLGEVCEFQRGLTYSKKDEVSFSNNIVLRANNIDLDTNKLNLNELRYISPNIEIKEDKIVRKNSLLICTASGSKSHLGKIALVDKDYGYAFGGFMGQITLSEKKLYYRYLFYYTISDSYKKFISSLTGGTNINNLKFGDLSKLEIPLPPLDEQKRIVAQLDEAFEKIEKAKEDAQKNLENAKEIFESELNSIFENPLEHWEEKELGEICEKITDGSHNPPRGIEYSEFLMLSSRNIFNDLITFQNPRYLKEEDFIKENKRTQLKSGDILLTIVGTIGRVAVVPEKTPKFTLQRSVGVLKPNLILIKSKYLMYSLQSKLIDLNNNSRGVAQKGLYLNQIRNYKISFPPSLEEQQEIVEKLNALQEKTKQLEEVYEKKLSNLDELRQSILQRAFRGGGEE